MKILLLITACLANVERINFQISNLTKHANDIKKLGIEPIFVFGKSPNKLDIPYSSWYLDVEERYTNLYQKIIKSFEKSLEYSYDFIIKIDDDTIVNWERFNQEYLKEFDYVGRMQQFYTQNKIVLDIPMYNIRTTINLFPSVYKENFSFATGDFYCLSRKVVEFLVSQQDIINDSFKEQEYVCEDQMIGYLIRNEEYKHLNLEYANTEIQLANKLQITKDLISIHPISSLLFKTIINSAPEQQLQTLISQSAVNLYYRETQLQKLQNDIVQTVMDFANSKKLMGIG